jgi:diguanylate cyclase (GGDEF)-like protein
MQPVTNPRRKIGLLPITLALAVVVWVVGAVVLVIMLRQQARIEADAQHIHDVSSAMVFEATRTIRALERLAREGDAITWIADPAERAARRQRMQGLTADAALQGDSETRLLVERSVNTLDRNLADLQSKGASARPFAEERWAPVMQALLSRSEAVGAAVSDLAGMEADHILESTDQARTMLLLVAAVLTSASGVLFAMLYFSLTRPVVRLAKSLLLAREGHPILSNKEVIHEVQMLHDAAVALGGAHRELESARVQLEQLAHTDALTGLANRRMFELYGRQAVAQARRYGEPLSIVAFDIDHFKHINDHYGHEGGDVVLRGLGAYLLETVRGADSPVARTGGEEFSLLLAQTALGDALQVAQRLCKGTSELQLTMPSGEVIGLTVSMGVAQFQADDADLSALMRRADLALYRAKKNGRNQVQVAD